MPVVAGLLVRSLRNSIGWQSPTFEYLPFFFQITSGFGKNFLQKSSPGPFDASHSF